MISPFQGYCKNRVITRATTSRAISIAPFQGFCRCTLAGEIFDPFDG